MNSVIIAQKLRTRISIKNKLFFLYLFVLLLMALCPPLYLTVSGSSALFLGIPAPIVYWLSIAVLLGVGLWIVYLVECAFGEIPEDEVSS